MNEPYVFISYSREDRDFVQRLSAALNQHGVATWTDVDNISPGSNWQDEIEKGLLGAEALLYVASKNSSTSRWIQEEVTLFLERNGRVIPLIIDELAPSVMPPFLRTIQWVDFRQDFDAGFESLVGGIESLRGAAVTTTAPKSKGYAFISYADEDSDFVAELKKYLKGRGYSYWDFLENERNYQVDYTLELESVITNAEATLSVISPAWKQSPTTLQELHFSKEVKKPVFLLRLKDPGPTFATAGMTFIDFTGRRNDGFARLDLEMKKFGL